jgi:hypothetical protein
MMFGTAQEFAEILARLPTPAPVQQPLADDREFMDWLKVNAHNQREANNVARIRDDLLGVLGLRFEQEIAKQIQHLDHLSKASLKKYKEDIKRLRLFCTQLGVSHLPAAPETVAAFLLDVCVGTGDEPPKPAMCSRICTSIRLLHQLKAVPDPTESFYIRAVRRWINHPEQEPNPVMADAPPDDQLN